MSTDRTADQVLELVQTAHPGAQAQVTVTRQAMALTRFAESFIHQNVAEESYRVAVHVHADGGTASASTNRTSTPALTNVVTAALAAAALRPPDPGYPGLTGPAPATGAGNWDAATAAATPGERAGVVAAFIDATKGLSCAGYCQTNDLQASYANSAGQRLSAHATQADVDAIARTGRSDGCARTSSVRLSDLDGAALGARAAMKARA